LLLQRYQGDECLLCSSGTDALRIALSTLTTGPNQARPVLLPAFTCYEVASAAAGARVRLALYDVDPVTLEPDWESIRSVGRRGAAALVVAPLFGMPVDWDVAREMAEAIGAPLIADVAQSQGATWKGAPAGSSADLIVLSFGRGKGWTGGGGGALLSRNQGRISNALEHEALTPLYRRRRRGEVRAVMAVISQFLLGRSAFYGLPASIPSLRLGETVYHPPRPPEPMRHVSAALLLANDAVSLREVSRRRNNAAQYTRWLQERRGIITAVPGSRLDGSSGALRYPLRVRGGWQAVRGTEAPRLGAAATYPATLQELPALRSQIEAGQPPVAGASLLTSELITLPTHSQTTEPERSRLVQLLAG
jgi:dTDP-4-amino-4,6-dideoxygalactose transaminase